MSMLQLLLLYATDAFIEYDAAQAGFDSPEFLRLLALAQRQTVPEAESVREALLTGQILLEPLTIAHAQDFDEEYADSLNQFSFPGFPGAGRAVFYLNLPMAIPVSAQEKEGAWAFLKLLITEDRYAARGRGGWLPLQADFEEKTAAMQDPDAEKLLRPCRSRRRPCFITTLPSARSSPTSSHTSSPATRLPTRSLPASSAAPSSIWRKPIAEYQHESRERPCSNKKNPCPPDFHCRGQRQKPPTRVLLIKGTAGGVVPSAVSGGARSTSHSSFSDRITEETENVKMKFYLRS